MGGEVGPDFGAFSVTKKPRTSSELEKFTFIFPGQSPTELRADPFLGAKVLQHAPDWLFLEAERWEHPWRFLLAVRDLPPACYDLFRAAETVSHAMNRVQNRLYGGATPQRDLSEEMLKRNQRGDKAGATQCAKKLVRAMLRHGLWKDHGGSLMTDKGRQKIDLWKMEAEQALKKRHGKASLKPLPTAEEGDPVACLIVSNWLRWGRDGEPGLCYYSDQALAQLMDLIITGRCANLHFRDTRTIYYRKLRQRLQLRQACHRKPLVTSAKRVPNARLIEIEMNFREGSQRHRLSNRQKLVIGGRQLYPLPG